MTVLVISATLLIWGVRLESRVDNEAALRSRLELLVAENRKENVIENERMRIRLADSGNRIEAALNKITDDLTSVKIAVGVVSRPQKP